MGRPKTIQQAAENLRQAAPLIQARYTAGIQGADWQTPAASDQAEQNWMQGLQAAFTAGSRRAGVLAMSNQMWQQLSINKGGPIIGTRITDAIPRYTANFGPILAAMSAAAQGLVPRTASATQNVNNRLLPIIAAAKEAAGKPMT